MRGSNPFGIAALAVLGALFAILVPILWFQDSDSAGEPNLALGELNQKIEILLEVQAQQSETILALETVMEQWLSRSPLTLNERRSVNQPTSHADDWEARFSIIEQEIARQAEQTRDLIGRIPSLQSQALVETKRRNPVTLWPSLEALEQDWRVSSEEANHSQQFQTVQDLLRTYGPPTEVYRPNGGILFYYRKHPEGSAGPALYFRLQDGIVVEFFVEDEIAKE